MTDIDFSQFKQGDRVAMLDVHFDITGVIDQLTEDYVQVWDAEGDHAHRAPRELIASLVKIDHEVQPDDALDYAPQPDDGVSFNQPNGNLDDADFAGPVG